MKRSFAACVLGCAAVLIGASPAMAGAGIPAPLVGVTGPFGLVAIGAAYGGYWVYRRLGNRS
jgi:hypothetical protein